MIRRRRAKGLSATIKSFIKNPKESFIATMIIFMTFYLCNNPEDINLFLMILIIIGCLIGLFYTLYSYFIKNSKKNKKNRRAKSKYTNKINISREYFIENPTDNIKTCVECGKEFLPPQKDYNLCFTCRKKIKK